METVAAGDSGCYLESTAPVGQLEKKIMTCWPKHTPVIPAHIPQNSPWTVEGKTLGQLGSPMANRCSETISSHITKRKVTMLLIGVVWYEIKAMCEGRPTIFCFSLATPDRCFSDAYLVYTRQKSPRVSSTSTL